MSVGLLGAVGFIVTADARVVNPLLHIIATEFKTDVGHTGSIVTAYAIPYGLFQLIYGPLGDRLGKPRVMTVALGLFAIGTAICAVAPDLLFLNLLRFLTGVAAAAMIPMSLAYIGDNFPYSERQAAIGQFVGLVALGNILSTSLGGIVGDYLNWRMIFLLYGLISLALFGWLWRTTRRLPKNQPKIENNGQNVIIASLKPYGQLLKNPAPRLVIIGVFIEGLFFFGGFSFLGAFLKDRYDLLYIAIGFMLSGFGLGNLIYSRSVRWLVRTFGENGLMMAGGWVCCICYLITALVQSWLLFIPVCVFLGLGYYMIHSTLQTKATELAPGARGTAVSLFAFSLFVGQGIGAAALGAVVDGPGYVVCFIISGVAMALLGMWLVFNTRRYSRNEHKVNELEAQSSIALNE